MHVLIILAHPNPDSLNHAIAHTAAATLRARGHTVVLHDLYAEGFQPVLPDAEMRPGAALPSTIAQHCGEVATADGIIVVHPNWWGKPPAILAGYIDRVFRLGVVYAFSEDDDGSGTPLGLLRARLALVFTTSNTPDDRERAIFGDPLESFWERCVFGLCGVPQVRRHNFSIVVSSTPEQRQEWLHEVSAIIDDQIGQIERERAV